MFPIPEMLFLVCDYQQHLQGCQVQIPSHRSYTPRLTLPKLCVRQQSGCITSGLLRHPEPEPGLPGLDCGCPLLSTHTCSAVALGEGDIIYCKGAKPRSSGFSFIFLNHCPHPKDPTLSPPGNPPETHPLPSRLAQETVAGKRQNPPHNVNSKLIAVFYIRKK